MDEGEKAALMSLFTDQRVASLAVLVDGVPQLGLVPFVASEDRGALLIHVSELARHTRVRPWQDWRLRLGAGDTGAFRQLDLELS